MGGRGPVRPGPGRPPRHPPPPKPKRIKGGEGFPPLPLPATPLRRTERKRDPAPPTLIGKIVWGKNRVLELPDGRKIPFSDWNHDPNDVHRLLKEARGALGIKDLKALGGGQTLSGSVTVGLMVDIYK